MDADQTLAAAFDAAGCFGIAGSLTGLDPLVRGHINHTFVASFESSGAVERFVLQRINDHVFGDPAGLMANVEAVIEHLTPAAADSDYEVLELVRTQDGAAWLAAESGAWRCFRFIEGTTSFERCSSPEQAFEVAKLVGWYQSATDGLDASSLTDVLPDFFSPMARLAQFERAIATMLATTKGAGLNDKRLKATIRQALSLSDLAERFGMHLHRGDFPVKVIHGDTKLNNVLFDSASGKPRALVDLDTTMPGYRLYDFGDLVRSAAATSTGDEADLSLAGVDFAIYDALREGYLERAGVTLNAKEMDALDLAGPLVSYMLGLRFLTDHLSGDAYFHTSRPGQNLDRARVQLAQAEAFLGR